MSNTARLLQRNTNSCPYVYVKLKTHSNFHKLTLIIHLTNMQKKLKGSGSCYIFKSINSDSAEVTHAIHCSEKMKCKCFFIVYA